MDLSTRGFGNSFSGRPRNPGGSARAAVRAGIGLWGLWSSSSTGHEWLRLERGVWRGHWNQDLIKGSALQVQCCVCLLKPELQRNQCSQHPFDVVSWGKTSKQPTQKAMLTFPPCAPDPELGVVFVAEYRQKTPKSAPSTPIQTGFEVIILNLILWNYIPKIQNCVFSVMGTDLF